MRVTSLWLEVTFFYPTELELPFTNQSGVVNNPNVEAFWKQPGESKGYCVTTIHFVHTYTPKIVPFYSSNYNFLICTSILQKKKS